MKVKYPFRVLGKEKTLATMQNERFTAFSPQGVSPQATTPQVTTPQGKIPTLLSPQGGIPTDRKGVG